MRILATIAACGALLLTGCAGPAPLQGSWYSDVKYPSYYDGASDNGAGPKSGDSQMMSIMGVVAMGDASVKEACSKGGISKIHTVDHHFYNVLGIYQTWTTLVTGN
jgi:hypothetical protein